MNPTVQMTNSYGLKVEKNVRRKKYPTLPIDAEIIYSANTIKKAGENVQIKARGFCQWLSSDVEQWLMSKFGDGKFSGGLPFDVYQNHFEYLEDESTELDNFFPYGTNILQLLRKKVPRHVSLLHYDASTNRAMIFDSGSKRKYDEQYQRQAWAYIGENGNVKIGISKAYEVQQPKNCARHALCALILKLGGEEPAQFHMLPQGVWTLCKAVVEEPETINHLSIKELVNMVAEPRIPQVLYCLNPLKWHHLVAPPPQDEKKMAEDKKNDDEFMTFDR